MLNKVNVIGLLQVRQDINDAIFVRDYSYRVSAQEPIGQYARGIPTELWACYCYNQQFVGHPISNCFSSQIMPEAYHTAQLQIPEATSKMTWLFYITFMNELQRDLYIYYTLAPIRVNDLPLLLASTNICLPCRTRYL